MLRALIVDDEKIARMRLKMHLKDFEITEADNFESAILELKKDFDLCFIDLNLDDQSTELFGLEVLKVSVSKKIYSVVMSSVNDEDIIEHAYQIGCNEFYNKGKEESSIKDIVNNFMKSRSSENYLTTELLFHTNSTSQEKIFKTLTPFIKTEIPICILGETGTGKTFIASKIHEYSERLGQFVEVNCGALSEELLDAELFGHSKGAYSGATGEQKGKLLLANGGTLFLDEIGSMSEKMQAKLLKAIEEKSFYPINSDKLVRSDFRLISATLEDLENKIKSGSFRFDLFQRICGHTIKMLPLRERREDIYQLFKEEIDKKITNNRKVVLEKKAKEFLIQYRWPGNIRQLKRIVDLILAIGKSHILESDLQNLLKNETNTKVATEEMIKIAQTKGLQALIEKIEEEIIIKTLIQNKNSIRKTMKDLNTTQSKVYKYKDKI
jgi:DNA-binding NtrC family response regulator